MVSISISGYPCQFFGWDSHEKHWYFGRTLYMLVRRNNFLPLTHLAGREPVFPLKTCVLIPRMITFRLSYRQVTYKLLDHWDINALIDINKRGGCTDGLPDDISLDNEAHPLCRADHRMCNWGYDKNKNAQKYRCPC